MKHEVALRGDADTQIAIVWESRVAHPYTAHCTRHFGRCSVTVAPRLYDNKKKLAMYIPDTAVRCIPVKSEQAFRAQSHSQRAMSTIQ